MERRDFLKASLAVAALAAVNPSAPFSAEEKVKVCVTKGSTKEAIARLLAPLGGLGNFIKKGSRVLVKANFSFSMPPEAGTSTDPELVRTFALMCREAGAANVIVLDNTIKASKVCLERTGIEAALKGLDEVKIAVPQKSPDFREVAIPKGKALTKVKLANDLFSTDVYINMPVAKSHGSTHVSFGLKNQMGLIQDRTSFHWKFDIHQGIADLATVARPQLTILDATRCLKTGGPGGPGTVVQKGLLVASTDPVALDAYATTLVEWQDKPTKPQDVKYIVYAAEHGLGVMDLAKMDVVEV
ncbi:MAG: DUF362 domain-containing protein [Candidatus Eisenbacteria bacterium]